MFILFISNTSAKRRISEFKRHLSKPLQFARGHGIERVIHFMNHAPCHKRKNVKRFIRAHPMLRTKLLPKRAPNLNPLEWKVNSRLKSAVCTNRSYRGDR